MQNSDFRIILFTEHTFYNNLPEFNEHSNIFPTWIHTCIIITCELKCSRVQLHRIMACNYIIWKKRKGPQHARRWTQETEDTLGVTVHEIRGVNGVNKQGGGHRTPWDWRHPDNEDTLTMKTRWQWRHPGCDSTWDRQEVNQQGDGHRTHWHGRHPDTEHRTVKTLWARQYIR